MFYQHFFLNLTKTIYHRECGGGSIFPEHFKLMDNIECEKSFISYRNILIFLRLFNEEIKIFEQYV